MARSTSRPLSALRLSPTPSRIEVLEDRIAPAVSASIQLTVLVITGDNLDNLVALRNDPNNANQVLIDVNDDGATTQDLGPFLKTQFTSVLFDDQGGNDHLIVDYTSGDPLSGGKPLLFSGDAGSLDKLTVRGLAGTAPLDTASFAPSSSVANSGVVTVNNANLTGSTLVGGFNFVNVTNLTVAPQAGVDSYTLDASTTANFGKLSGTSNTLAQLIEFRSVANLTVNLGIGDGSTPVNDTLAVKALAGQGLTNLTYNGGAGNDTLDLQVASLALPTPGGAFRFNAGTNLADNDTVKSSAATGYTLDGVAKLLFFDNLSRLEYDEVETFDLTAGKSFRYLGATSTDVVSYFPSGTVNNSGSLVITDAALDSVTANFSGPLTVQDVSSLNVQTPAGADDLDLDAGMPAGFLTLSGKVAGVAGPTHTASFGNVANLNLNLGTADTAADGDSVTINTLSGINLQSLTVDTGAGDDTLTVATAITSFVLPLPGGTFQFNAGAGQDTLQYSADLNMTLADNGLTLFSQANANLGTLGLSGLEIANLTGGASANTFTVSGYSGQGTITGDAQDTIVAQNNVASFTLTDTSLARTGQGTLTLAGIGIANLTGGAGQNSFTVSGWSGTGKLTGLGDDDTVVAENNVADFGLSDTQLTRTGLGALTLETIEVANLTGGGSANTFTITSFTGDATLAGAGGADVVNLTAAQALDLELTSGSAATISYPGSDIDVTDIEDLQLHGTSLSLTGSSAVPGTPDDEVTWEPNAIGTNPGKLTLVNGAVTRTVSFDGVLTSVTDLKSLTLKTPAGADAFTIGANAPTPSDTGTISGTVAGSPGVSYSTIFENVTSITLDLGASDPGGAGQSDTVTVNSLEVDGLQNFTIKTGEGDDTITLGSTLTSLELPESGGAFTIEAGDGADKLIITADEDVTLTNTATVFRVVYDDPAVPGDESELAYSGLENFDLTVDTLTYSGSEAETLLWTPLGTATDDHEGTITVNNTGQPLRTITYDLDIPAVPTDSPLAFRDAFKLTLETAAGADTFTLDATASTGVARLSGSGGAGVAHSATLSTIDTIILDLGKNDNTAAVDKLTVSSLELEGANSLTVSTGDGDDVLELTSDLTTTKLGLANATPTGTLTFDAGAGAADKIKATRLATAGSIELTNTGLAYGSTTNATYTAVEVFELAADQVNYSGTATETVALTPSGANAKNGSATLGGGRTLNYTGKVGILSVTNLNITTPAGADSLTLSGASIGSFTGTVAGSINQAIDFSGVANVTVDLASNDGVAATNDSLKISSLSASALQSFSVITGGGDDTLELLAGLTSLVLPGSATNHVTFDAGTGTDKIKAEANVSMVLGKTGNTTQEGLAYQDNTTNHGAAGFIDFTGNAVELAELTGGVDDNRFLVSAWAHPATINGLGGADLFDVSGGLTGGTAGTPSTLSGGEGNDTFIVQTTVDAAINGLTGTATIDGGNGSDTIVASGNVNFVLKNTDLTRSVVAFKTTPASTLTITTSALEKAEFTGGVRANLLDAGEFNGTSKLIGKGGLDNLVAGQQGGELYGFDVTLPTAQQLKNKPFAATYTRDNYFVSDGTVSGATTSILAAKKTSNVISFRYFQSNDAALGIQYTLQLNNSSNTQQVSRVAGQDLNVTVGINGVASGQIDILEGSSYNDRLTGSKRTNILAGLRGNDHLIAVGVDFRYGGPGADTFAGPPSFAFQDRTFAIPGADGASKTKVRSAYTPVSTPFPRPGPVEITEESIFPSTEELIYRIAGVIA